MICIGEKLEDKEYEKRNASFGVVFNEDGKIVVVDIYRFGLNLPGGKIEPGEDSKGALIRETEEEIGYDLKDVEFFDKVESYYPVMVRGETIYTHAISDFYIARIGNKNNKKIEDNQSLLWKDIEEVVGKMYFEYHNYVLNKVMEKIKAGNISLRGEK